MDFDPNKPFKNLDQPSGGSMTFDPSKPFKNVENEQPSSIMDVLKSLPRAVLGGFLDTASAQGQAEAGQMGMEGVPPSEEALKLIEQHVTGKLHEPETEAGKWAAAGARPLGNPGTYLGGGGLARQALTGIAGGLGAEAGGRLGGTPGAIAGGIAGTAGPSALSRGAKSLLPSFQSTPERAGSVQTLRGAGIIPSAGDVTGSSHVRMAEELGAGFGGGDSYAKLKDAPLRQFGRAVTSQMGVSAERATPEVIDKARKDIGEELNRAASVSKIRFTKKLTTSFGDIYKEALNEPASSDSNESIARWVRSQIDKITEGFEAGGAKTAVNIPDIDFINDTIKGATPAKVASGFEKSPATNKPVAPKTAGQKTAGEEFLKTLKNNGAQQPIITKFRELLAGHVTRLDDQMRKDADKAIQFLKSKHGGDGTPTKPATGLKAAPSTMDGNTYQALTEHSSALSRAMRSADGAKEYFATKIRDALDDALEETAFGQGTKEGTGLRLAYEQVKNARRKWYNMLVISKAVAGAGEDAAEGTVLPDKLQRAITSGEDKALAYAAGKGSLHDLARAGANVLTKEKAPDLMLRSQMHSMPRAVVGGTMGLAASGGNPLGAGLGAIAGFAAPGVAGRLANSRAGQRFLQRTSPPKLPSDAFADIGRGATIGASSKKKKKNRLYEE